MYNILALSLGEVFLRGKNKITYEKQILKQINSSLKEIKDVSIYKDFNKIYIVANNDDLDRIIDITKKIFGISVLIPCIKTEKTLESITNNAIELMQYLLNKRAVTSFKIETNRSDKQFEIPSMELSRIVGGEILKKFSGLKVDVHNPDVEILIDIKGYCYISSEKIKTVGGLPTKSDGRGLLLLSGGIDSPVAGYMMAKRGVEISAIYFHTYPFTSLRANEKIIKLKEILEGYCGQIDLYMINMLEIYQEIKSNCEETQITILARRFMMRIATEIAKKNKIHTLITGESLGQVASQTMKSIIVIENSTDMPIFRPLIGMDKLEIIGRAKEIGTYETSIIPYDDCCSLFSPEFPILNPNEKYIKITEENINIDRLIENAISTLEIF